MYNSHSHFWTSFCVIRSPAIIRNSIENDGLSNIVRIPLPFKCMPTVKRRLLPNQRHIDARGMPTLRIKLLLNNNWLMIFTQLDTKLTKPELVFDVC